MNRFLKVIDILGGRYRDLEVNGVACNAAPEFEFSHIVEWWECKGKVHWQLVVIVRYRTTKQHDKFSRARIRFFHNK
jgi:hypothetical protein